MIGGKLEKKGRGRIINHKCQRTLLLTALHVVGTSIWYLDLPQIRKASFFFFLSCKGESGTHVGIWYCRRSFSIIMRDLIF